MNMLLTLIEAARVGEDDPRRWNTLAVALQAHGYQYDAGFCKWRARVCRQDPTIEARSRHRVTVRSSIWPDRIRVAEPLTLNQNLEYVLFGLIDRLLEASDKEEITLASQTIVLFAGVKALRIDATHIIARRTWALARNYLLDQEHEIEGTGVAYRIANLWAMLLRACPKEMSHAALQAGMQNRPTLEDLGAWKRFTVMVSRARGTSMGEIMHQQVADLS